MNFIKKYKNYFLAFIIPFILCLLIFFAKNVLNNVESIYVSDLRLQHVVFLNYFKSLLLGDTSIFYSFYSGMGSPMLSTIIFYCLSPVNLLLLLVKDIRVAVLFVYIVKVSLSGLTMFILLKNKVDRNNFSTVVFSSCYALGAFAINYFFCVFWFDVLYLAPLVVLGIDKIFKYEKINLLYILSLALAIICNIQMGFGLCVFSVVYYIYSYNCNYNIKKDFNKFKNLSFIFLVSSLCAGAISSGALLGFVIDYGNVSAARDITVTTSAATTNLGFVLKNLFSVGNVATDYYNNYEPYVYSGLIVSFFAVLYFFNKDIDIKKKVHALGVFLVFLISFGIGFINLFWHLSSPVLLNYRYSIYLSLFLTLLAYECYVNKDKLIKKDIISLVCSLFIGFFILVLFSNDVYLIWTFLFLILICVGIYLVKNKSRKFEILLFSLVFLEIFMSGYLSIYTADDMPFGKYSSLDSFKKVSELNTFDDNYRIMYNYSYTDFTNDTLLVNNNTSLRYFSSVINGNVIKFFDRNMSAVGNNNYRLSAFDSPLLLSLMGNKYFYFTDELNNSIYKKIKSYEIDSYNYVEAMDETKDVYLYENPYALSLGYVIDSDFKYEEGMDLVDYQNNIIKSFTGSDKDVVIRLNYDVTTDDDFCRTGNGYGSCYKYTIYNDYKNLLVYVYTLFDEYQVSNNVNVYIDTNKPLLLSSLSNRINFAIKYSGGIGEKSLIATTYDKDNLISNLSSLQENMLENIKINGNVMTGEIDSSKDGILFLSIPYEKKFKIYVDKKQVDYYSVLDNSFVGLDIESGKHDIKVEYVDDNFKWYVVSSVLSLVVTLVIYHFINKTISKRQEKELLEQKELEIKRELAKKNKNNKKKKKKK